MILSNAASAWGLTFVCFPVTRIDCLPDARAASVWMRSCLVKSTLMVSFTSTDSVSVKASGMELPSWVVTLVVFFERLCRALPTSAVLMSAFDP